MKLLLTFALPLTVLSLSVGMELSRKTLSLPACGQFVRKVDGQGQRSTVIEQGCPGGMYPIYEFACDVHVYLGGNKYFPRAGVKTDLCSYELPEEDPICPDHTCRNTR